MIKLLQCEYKKTRGRYLFITAFAITAVQLCWILYGKYEDKFILQNGWMMFLYQLPLVNAIFLPLLSTIVASRLCDIEHKGIMFKQLSVITEKKSIYNTKLLYGLGITLFCVLLDFAAVIAAGYFIGFTGRVPLRLYLLYLLFTAAPTIVIYIFQHNLSIIFKNQAIAFFTGIAGTFLGMFSMFLPNLPFLRRILIWGYYGTLQFVGLFGWTSETRYENAYFEIMQIDWLFFAVLIFAGIALYYIGRNIFCRKEV